ncbi:transketolase family protein [Candidatus Parcubacteria bacterium]|nr:transketolase family protein [Candidatus Parcubacteria bacterium]
MLNPEVKLNENLFEKPDQAPSRDGFGKGLLELGEKDPRVLAVCADLAESVRMLAFKEKYPERFIEVGVAEQNLATVASGLANYGKIPFISSYATFSPGRNNEQIRTTISLNNLPVKIAGSHAGLSVGPDGATHQALEDIALMRVQPNMTVVSPADSEEARKATIAAVAHDGPVYIRLAREKSPIITTPDSPFIWGKANVLWEGVNPQVTIIATGPLVYNALLAAKELAQELSVVVINLHTIKPLDIDTVLAYAQKTSAIVTVEEHQVAGGMGSAVAEVLSAQCPVPLEFIGVHDQFGQSGEPKELIEHYQMGVSHVVAAVRKVIARKK